MARMSIDDKFLRDPNVRVLAKLCGWSVRETRGCLLDVWAVCYDQMTALLSKAVVDVAAELEGFADKLVQAELASMDRSGRVRIRGASKRIEYLLSQRERGSQGGTKRAYSPEKVSSKRLSNPEVSAQAPAASTLKPLTLTVPDTPSASVSAPDTDTDKKKERDGEVAPDGAPAASPPARSSRGSKPKGKVDPAATATPAELESARVIFEKLRDASGTAWQVRGENLALVLARLREGYDEMTLRRVIAYCASPKAAGGLGWEDSDEMRQYLRPVTLFGSKTIARYADPASSWDAKRASTWKRAPNGNRVAPSYGGDEMYDRPSDDELARLANEEAS